MYEFKDSKANVINILKSKTPIKKMEYIPSDDEFTYENGVETFVSAIFIDIKNSSKLFHERNEKLARLLRAFTSEIITILNDNSNLKQIGIRGDCVYGIYSTPKQNDIVEIYEIAVTINTFLLMFNNILSNYNYNVIEAGIGLGCDRELIIKAGRKGSGVNDKIWIGDAVVDAANLSTIAKREFDENIAMNKLFYDKIKNHKFANLITEFYSNKLKLNIYKSDAVLKNIKKWIIGGMKDNV